MKINSFFLTLFLFLMVYSYFGDDMKKMIRGFVIPVFIALLVGYIGGKYVYGVYLDNLYDSLSSSRLYLVESGEYDSYDKMRENNNSTNYVYYKDNDKYKTVVGITKNYSNVKKIESLYDSGLLVTEYYVPNEMVDSKQDEYDKELMEVSDYQEVREIVDNILNLYRSDDKIRLISID